MIANRLTENPDISVLSTEAGPRDNSLKLKTPAAFIYNYTSPQFNWMYHTEAEPHMDGRPIFCPRGKVLAAPPASTAWLSCAATPAISTEEIW